MRDFRVPTTHAVEGRFGKKLSQCRLLEAWRDLTQGQDKAALVCAALAEDPRLTAIRRGARLIVATPGRQKDYLSRRLVRLADVKILVLDEVDRMLDMGFTRDESAQCRIETTTLATSRPISVIVRQVFGSSFHSRSQTRT